MTSDDASAPGGDVTARGRGRCRSTPAGRTRPGCTTTCSAARTTTPPTGRPPRQRSRSTRTGLSPRGRTGRSSAAPSATSPGEAGIRQFLDIGTGIPTAGNTHQVAQAIAPESRVVYVDYDPSCSPTPARCSPAARRAPPSTSTPTCATPAPSSTRPRELLDFTKPVAVTLVAILHAIPDADDPHAIVARLLDAVPPGSYLAISHLGPDLLDPETLQEASRTRSGRQDPAADHLRATASRWRVLRGHRPGGARARAGRGMAPGPGHERHRQVVPVGRGRPQALMAPSPRYTRIR